MRCFSFQDIFFPLLYLKAFLPINLGNSIYMILYVRSSRLLGAFSTISTELVLSQHMDRSSTAASKQTIDDA